MYIKDRYLKEFSVRLGDIETISEDELETIASLAGRRYRISFDIHNGGRMNHRVFHVVNYSTALHPEDFSKFLSEVVERIETRISEQNDVY